MTKHSRPTDPSTSHRAWDQHVRSGNLGNTIIEVYHLVKQNPGNTVGELATLMVHEHPDRYAYPICDRMSKRLSDLVGDGKLTKAPARLCRVTGHSAHTWYIRQ